MSTPKHQLINLCDYQTPKELETEVISFFRTFFPGKFSQTVVDSYKKIHQVRFKLQPESELKLIRKAIDSGASLEALEFVLRPSRHLLSKKIQAFCYLLEVRPEFQSYFYNFKTNRIKGYTVILISGLNAIRLFLYGQFLVWKFRHEV
jgi:hypothetical protein